MSIKIEMIVRRKGIDYLDQNLIRKVFGGDYVASVTTRSFGGVAERGWSPSAAGNG